MSEHNPAPWNAGKKMPHGSDVLWDAVFDATGELVAYVNDPSNVPVITSAPKLLAALKKAVDGGCVWHSGADLVEAERVIAEATP